MRVSARRRGRCHPRGTPTSRVVVVTVGTRAGATTDANDRDAPVSLTWTPRHFEPRILPMDICRGMRDRGTRAWDSPFILYGTDVVHDRRHRARRRRPRARRLANPRSTARVAPRAVCNWPRPFTRARGVRHTPWVMTHEKLYDTVAWPRRQSLLDGIFIYSKLPATPHVSRDALRDVMRPRAIPRVVRVYPVASNHTNTTPGPFTHSLDTFEKEKYVSN